MSVISAAMPGLTAATAWAIQHSTCAEALEANYHLPGPPSRKGISALQHTYRRTLSPDGRVKPRIPSRTPQGDRVPCIRSGQRVCVRCSYSSTLSRDTTEIFNRALFPTDIQAIFAADSAGKCKDDDHDGVPNDKEVCPETPAGEVADTSGCSINQLCPCNGPWKNHGAYV